MRQIAKKSNNSSKSIKKKKPFVHRGWSKRSHKQQFGTSKLEIDFATQFLDKLGVEYQWQFEAKDIGRFFDYWLPKQNVILEINGSYWHSDPRIYEGKELNATQKKNIRVDEYKQKWALMHSIPVYYIWEKDIRENPSGVMKYLQEILHLEDKKQMIIEEKNKRHKNPMRDIK